MRPRPHGAHSPPSITVGTAQESHSGPCGPQLNLEGPSGFLKVSMSQEMQVDFPELEELGLGGPFDIT